MPGEDNDRTPKSAILNLYSRGSNEPARAVVPGESVGARRWMKLTPPHPELERLLRENAARVAKMTDEERRKMVDEQVRNIMPIQPDEMRPREAFKQGLYEEEKVVRDELRIGRVTPLTVNGGDRKGIMGGCVKRDSFDPRPFQFPRPHFDAARELRETARALREAEEKYKKLRDEQPTDDISLFEKQLREARCPICGGREGCDHSKEERIREFARAGIRAQAKVEQRNEASRRLREATETLRVKDDGPSYEKAEVVLDQYLSPKQHGCQGTPEVKDTGPKKTTATQPRILIVVSNESQRFRLKSLTADSRFLIVLPVDAIPFTERFAAVVVACRDHIQKLDLDLGRKLERDTLRTWLNSLRYVTVNGDLKDVIYL